MSALLLVSGVLPIGFEVDGVPHRDFVVGPLSVLDSLEADAEATAERPDSVDEARFRVLCRLGRAVRSIGTLTRPLDGVKALQLYEVDFNALIGASKEVDEKIAAFRSPATADGAGGEGDRLVGGGAPLDA